MIQQLKRKFIWINMLLVSIVLLSVFATILVFNHNRLVSESMGAMDRMLTWDPKFEPMVHEITKVDDRHKMPLGLDGKPKKPMAFLPAFGFTLNADLEVENLRMDNVSVSSDVVSDVVSKLKPLLGKDYPQEGTLMDLSLRYKLVPSEQGYKVALVDMSREWDETLSLAGTLSLVGLGAMGSFLVISIFLSRWALKPVEVSWQQQRQFVADASHELRTPLTVILANIGILKNHSQSTVGEQIKWINHTQTEAERMKTLIDDLLFLAKSDANQMPITLSELNLSDLAWRTVLPFESVAFEQHIQFDYQIEDGIMVTAEMGQTKQLMAILLDNACKYAGKDGRVALNLKQLPEGKFILSVFNTGEWIPETALGKIFDRFYRVDSSRVREEGGYGLGLAIAKSIVERQGWKISVTSSETEGTTFAVWL